MKREWIKTSDRLPKHKHLYENGHIECFIFHHGHIEIRPFNTRHQCWDDPEYDDHCYDAEDPSHWMLIEWPEKPEGD